MKFTTGFSILLAGAALSFTPAARAAITMQWAAQTGTADRIAVGARNIPWILLRRTGEVAYGMPAYACSAGICVATGTTKWTNVHGHGTAIAVDRAGWPFTMDGNVLSFFNWPGSGSSWVSTPTTVAGGGTACFSSFAVAQETERPISGIFPSHDTGGPTPVLPLFWGIDCSPDENLWRLDANLTVNPFLGQYSWSTKQWTPVDIGDHHVALFSTNNGQVVVENPWVASDGGVYAYNGSSFTHLNVPGYVTDITDHYILTSAGVYEWTSTGDIYGSTATGNTSRDWRKVAGQTPNAPRFPLAHIAYSSAIVYSNDFGQSGPSRLWGIDTLGTIYELLPFDDGVVK